MSVTVPAAGLGLSVAAFALLRRARPDLQTAFSPLGYRTTNWAFLVGLGGMFVGFLSILALGGSRPATLVGPDAAHRWAWIGPFVVGAIGFSVGTLAVAVELAFTAVTAITGE